MRTRATTTTTTTTTTTIFSLPMKRKAAVLKIANRMPIIRSNNFTDGVLLILKDSYILLILGMTCLYEISLTILDFEMKLIAVEQSHRNHTQLEILVER